MFLQPNGHLVMTGFGLVFIGPAEPIPDRKVKAVITIGFAFNNGMVHAVHIGGDDKNP